MCSFESKLLAVHQKKTTKYTSLKSDIDTLRFMSLMDPFEIGSRGYVFKENRGNII